MPRDGDKKWKTVETLTRGEVEKISKDLRNTPTATIRDAIIGIVVGSINAYCGGALTAYYVQKSIFDSKKKNELDDILNSMKSTNDDIEIVIEAEYKYRELGSSRRGWVPTGELRIEQN